MQQFSLPLHRDDCFTNERHVLHLSPAQRTLANGIVQWNKLTMITDHGSPSIMDKMAISKFKATCLATLERVRRTGRPLRVTRFGKPIADIVPPAPEPRRREWLGSLRGSLEISGDIVRSTSDLARWEAVE